MALKHLFARCPVLPVDAEISLARYLTSAEETSATASSVEQSNPERAALLHIRIVQLVAKTLPSHPDRALRASAPVLAKLDDIAHDSLDAVERLARTLEAPSSPTMRTVQSAGALSVPGLDTRDLLIPAPLLDVFGGMVRDRALRGERSVGVLAARIVDPNDVVRVTALVVPAQRTESSVTGPDEAVRHDSDVRDLAAHKSLSLVGIVVHAPEKGAPSLLDCELRAALKISAPQAAVAVFAAPNSSNRVALFDVHADGSAVSRSQRARLITEPEPTFKLYDLRSLAAARDAQAEKAAQLSRGSIAPQDL